MLCPKDNSKDFDDIDCRDCEWYMQCFKMWNDGNIWGKIECSPECKAKGNCSGCKWEHQKNNTTLGDNFPKMNNNCPADNGAICNKGKACDSCRDNKITKEELDKFKIELGEIIYIDDLIKKFKE
jgi:hypothetical protein